MSFLTEFQKKTNVATTENGAPTLRTSNNPLVDFFALAGATRGNPEMGLDLFKKAFAYDRLSAVRLLFYFRDVRGGQGERQLFRNCLQYLAENENEIAERIAHYVPEYGRWDDLLVLQVETIVPLITAQMKSDLLTDKPSLMAKWLPSVNTSSKATVKLGRALANALDLSEVVYRKTLSKLRKKIKLVEHKMSDREWGKIEYETVPSQASAKYRKAFYRNDEVRYQEYLNSVDKGEKKINTSTLFPYQVYKTVGQVGAEQLWNNLPDYTRGNNAIVVADVSGSMYGDPMAVSVSLALYFAERNKGRFKDHFITFSESPILQKIVGKTLRDKVNSIERSNWSMNTDLYKVFKCVADAISSSEDMPETIYIISDMEFDACVHNKTNFQAIDDLFNTKGLKRPNLVFWNVNARNKQVPVEFNTDGVALVSGLSPAIFKMVVENKTPIELVQDVVSAERYSIINI